MVMKNPSRRVDRDTKIEVKVGSVSIPIYHAPIRVRLTNSDSSSIPEHKIYESWMVVYYEGSRRVRRRQNSLAKAKDFAKEVATRLNEEGARAECLSAHDCRIYTLAKQASSRVGLEVDEVCRRYFELTQRIECGTLEEAVDFMNEHAQGIRLGTLTTEVFAEYIQHLERRGVGDYHLRDVKRLVGGFVQICPAAFSQIRTPEIDDHLAGLGGTARNKNNHRKAIITFFNFAKKKGFLPYGLPHAASGTTEFLEPRREVASEADARALLEPKDIYTPEEARSLLAAIEEPELRSTVEIKMLSGVRTEEMVRLWWVMVAEKEGLIRIPDVVGKIDARRVPILPALARRLEAVADSIKLGRIAAKWTTANSLYHAWHRVCRKSGVPYRKNAFRNSYFTYRLAIVGDIHKVADEGGTSPQMLKKNYLSRAPVSVAQAEAWFEM